MWVANFLHWWKPNQVQMSLVFYKYISILVFKTTCTDALAFSPTDLSIKNKTLHDCMALKVFSSLPFHVKLFKTQMWLFIPSMVIYHAATSESSQHRSKVETSVWWGACAWHAACGESTSPMLDYTNPELLTFWLSWYTHTHTQEEKRGVFCTSILRNSLFESWNQRLSVLKFKNPSVYCWLHTNNSFSIQQGMKNCFLTWTDMMLIVSNKRADLQCSL